MAGVEHRGAPCPRRPACRRPPLTGESGPRPPPRCPACNGQGFAHPWPSCPEGIAALNRLTSVLCLGCLLPALGAGRPPAAGAAPPAPRTSAAGPAGGRPTFAGDVAPLLARY